MVAFYCLGCGTEHYLTDVPLGGYQQCPTCGAGKEKLTPLRDLSELERVSLASGQQAPAEGARPMKVEDLVRSMERAGLQMDDDLVPAKPGSLLVYRDGTLIGILEDGQFFKHTSKEETLMEGPTSDIPPVEGQTTDAAPEGEVRDLVADDSGSAMELG